MRITHGPVRSIEHEVRTFLWLRTNEPNLLVVFMSVRDRSQRLAILKHRSVNASEEELAEYLRL